MKYASTSLPSSNSSSESSSLQTSLRIYRGKDIKMTSSACAKRTDDALRSRLLRNFASSSSPSLSSWRIKRHILSIKSSTCFIFVLLLLDIFILPTLAAPQQHNTANPPEDSSLYSYYYHHDNNNYNGMQEYVSEYVSDWSHEWAKMSGRIQTPKCVEIPSNLTLCQNIGYEKMMLPNLLDHDSMTEVIQQARSWVPLNSINCHPDTKVFLCSLFSPVCLDRLIYPCRSLCQKVRKSCERRMNYYNFTWPDMLNCDKFPQDNDMCIMPIHDVKPDNNCTACKHPHTHEALIDQYCRSDVAMRVTLKGTKPRMGDSELVLLKKRKIYKPKFKSKDKNQARRVKKMPVVITGGATCQCQTINSTGQKYLLMGNKVNDRIVINFGMAWNKQDIEFKKGLRAIRKFDCKQLFKTVIDGLNESKPAKAGGSGKRKGKKNKKGKGKKGSKKRKKKKNRRKGKGKGGKKKKCKGKGKGCKKNGKKGDDGGKKLSKRDKSSKKVLSKAEREDLALSSFMNFTSELKTTTVKVPDW